MAIYELDGHAPELPPAGRYYIAPGARVIGRVTLEEDTSIWFNAVLRADNEPIRIGRGSNVQDGCVFHVDPGFPLTVGADVTVGHMALLHGCTVGDGTLVGMGAVVLNGARIGRECVIGANALITEGKEIPDRSLVMGQPGKVIRTLDDAASAQMRRGAVNYRNRQAQYLNGLREIDGA
ncbi:MAG: gamma carbonic anhydrase family protein [Pseudomonadota bacterium]